jgi:hypothetical protein
MWHPVSLESIALLYCILFVFITNCTPNMVFVFFICYTCLRVVDVRVSWCCEISYFIFNSSMHFNFIYAKVWLFIDDYCPKQFALTLSIFYGEVYG